MSHGGKHKSLESWGRDKAHSMTKHSKSNVLEGHSKTNDHQPPQDPQDQHGSNYDNDASGFVRGMGKESPYPHFDKGREGKP